MHEYVVILWVTCNHHVDYDNQKAQNDGNTAEQASQASQAPRPIHIALLYTVSRLQNIKDDFNGS